MCIIEPQILIKHRQLCSKTCNQVLFARAIYHTSKHFWACVGACTCDRTSLLKRPAFGILSKIRHNVNPTILKVVYYSLFGSNLLYGAQLWGQTNLVNQNSIQVLQNCAIRKICFKKPNKAVSGDFKKFGMLKFHDFIKLQNCILICQLEQDEQLAKTFPDLKYCGDNHNYQTRSTTKRLLDTPLLNTDTYGMQSTKYNCIADWNSFRKTFKDLPLSECSRFKVKKLLMQLFLNKY